jgi:hypothetical protein
MGRGRGLGWGLVCFDVCGRKTILKGCRALSYVFDDKSNRHKIKMYGKKILWDS